MFYSQREDFDKINLSEVQEELSTGKDAGVSVIVDKSLINGKSIPRWIDNFRLRQNQLKLRYYLTEESIFFEFRFVDLVHILKLKR